MQGGDEFEDAGILSIWRGIVEQLNGNLIAGHSGARRIGHQSQHAHIEVLEYLGDGEILIAWKDATCCRYGHQRWISTMAQTSGRCALSGATIAEDDVIYKPEERRPRLINSKEMILARAIREKDLLLES